MRNGETDAERRRGEREREEEETEETGNEGMGEYEGKDRGGEWERWVNPKLGGRNAQGTPSPETPAKGIQSLWNPAFRLTADGIE